MNVNVNVSGRTGSGGNSILKAMPQMVYQAQRDRGEDDIINKFNNLLNKVGSKPPVDKLLGFDMQTQVNPMTNDMGTQFKPKINEMNTQTDNPIFTDASSNIEIVRKPDLSNQTLLENINTPQIDDMALKVNEPDVNEIAKYENEPDFITVENTPEKQKQSSIISGSGYTMYRPLKERSKSVSDKTRSKTPSREEIRALRMPSLLPVETPKIKVEVPVLASPIEQPIFTLDIKQINKQIKKKEKEMDELNSNKDNIKWGEKGKYSKKLKDLQVELKTLIFNRDLKLKKLNG